MTGPACLPALLQLSREPSEAPGRSKSVIAARFSGKEHLEWQVELMRLLLERLEDEEQQ